MKILCFKKKILQDLGYFEGFSRNKELFNQINQPKHLEWVERDYAEKEPLLKQVIPYVTYSYLDKELGKVYFNYERTKKGGENRLHLMRSCGIGGHIEKSDGNLKNAFKNGMMRELKEEVKLPVGTSYSLKFLGLINDDSTEVNSVHFGVSYLAELKNPTVITSEDPSIKTGGFENMRWLNDHFDSFETWSQLVLNNLGV